MYYTYSSCGHTDSAPAQWKMPSLSCAAHNGEENVDFIIHMRTRLGTFSGVCVYKYNSLNFYMLTNGRRRRRRCMYLF